jgi:translation initiation factor eIF-2B subunit epsilon
MPPKKGPPPPKAPKQAAKAPPAEATEASQPDPLQAIILTDTFSTSTSHFLAPSALERPSCLFPLANTRLLEYTLRFLLLGGVDEIIVAVHGASQLGKQVEEFLSNTTATASHILKDKVTIFRSLGGSVGDVLRDVDQRGLAKGDFIVVDGNFLGGGSWDLRSVIDQHKRLRKERRDLVMTVLLKEASGERHRARSIRERGVWTVNAKGRVLGYDEIDESFTSTITGEKRFAISPEFLSTEDELEVRSDLIDTGLDIYTPDALALWTDSFDYLLPRKHFLVGVLRDYELNGKTIYAHVLGDGEYAANVREWGGYNSVTRDVMDRWAFPFVPDNNFLSLAHEGNPGEGRELAQADLTLGRGGIYKSADVVLARTCVVGEKTLLGKGTSIGEGSKVTNSILGQNCQIGKNVIIDRAVLWDHVVVGDKSHIGEALLATEVVIGKGCEVKAGAVLSFGVRIGDGANVEKNTRIWKKGDGEQEENIVGKGGEGAVFVDEDAEDDEEEGEKTAACFRKFLVILIVAWDGIFGEKKANKLRSIQPSPSNIVSRISFNTCFFRRRGRTFRL